MMSTVYSNSNFLDRRSESSTDIFAPRNESTMSLSLSIANIPGSESSQECKFQTAKVPPMELLLLRAKRNGNESSSYHNRCRGMRIYTPVRKSTVWSFPKSPKMWNVFRIQICCIVHISQGPRSFSLPGLAWFNPGLYQAVLFQQPV